jgi:hypothetical protein
MMELAFARNPDMVGVGPQSECGIAKLVTTLLLAPTCFTVPQHHRYCSRLLKAIASTPAGILVMPASHYTDST